MPTRRTTARKRKVAKEEAENKVEPALADPVETKITELIKQDPGICNHRNLHYTAGELLCVLNKGHTGDHFGYVGSAQAAWSDAAGIPVKKHA